MVLLTLHAAVVTPSRARRQVFTSTFGKTPQYQSKGGSSAEDIALQNIQARLRMVQSYLLAQVRRALDTFSFNVFPLLCWALSLRLSLWLARQLLPWVRAADAEDPWAPGYQVCHCLHPQHHRSKDSATSTSVCIGFPLVAVRHPHPPHQFWIARCMLRAVAGFPVGARISQRR